jgi:hypothetical protein
MRIFIFIATAIVSLSITVPLQNNNQRCMMVFTYGSQETIKLDLKFPRVADRQNEEYFELSLRNTDNQ